MFSDKNAILNTIYISKSVKIRIKEWKRHQGIIYHDNDIKRVKTSIHIFKNDFQWRPNIFFFSEKYT